MIDQPPQHGLTRENTGYPHPQHPGWFITDDGVAAIERRSVKPDASDVVLVFGYATKCKTCGETFRTGMPQQVRRCPKCRATSLQGKKTAP